MLFLGYAAAERPKEQLSRDLLLTADEMDGFIKGRARDLDLNVPTFKHAISIQFVARGAAMPAAQQAALTFMEGVKIPTGAYTGGGFRHGPFETVGKGRHAVCFAQDNENGRLVVRMASDMADAGSTVLMFSEIPVSQKDNLAVVPVKCPDPRLFSAACAVPQELLLARLAEQRGIVPGTFVRGQKVTQVE